MLASPLFLSISKNSAAPAGPTSPACVIRGRRPWSVYAVFAHLSAGTDIVMLFILCYWHVISFYYMLFRLCLMLYRFTLKVVGDLMDYKENFRTICFHILPTAYLKVTHKDYFMVF